ncbi:hypothetical protein J6590_082214 [Homalodisca vitripennis]|nr:hypothetical protein J6590_082214 [Homalodisca vitripennis]
MGKPIPSRYWTDIESPSLRTTILSLEVICNTRLSHQWVYIYFLGSGIGIPYENIPPKLVKLMHKMVVVIHDLGVSHRFGVEVFLIDSGNLLTKRTPACDDVFVNHRPVSIGSIQKPNKRLSLQPEIVPAVDL